MGSSLQEERRQRLLVRTTEPEGLAEYTGDGSVDFRGYPILKHNTGNWRACSLILGTEVCERLAYYGISKSLVTYLSKRLHEGNVSAARNFTTWQGTCYLTPLIGATLADSYWGKYRTIAVFSAIYFLVVVAAIHKRKADLPVESSLLYELDGKTSAIEGSRKLEHSSEFSFLDKAAVILWDECDGSPNPWRLYTVTQVEELKILMRMFPIWATGIVFFTVCAQNSSMFIEQGMALDNQIGSFKIPPATLSSLDVISIVVWVPIYERFVVPVARRFTGNERGFSELQRIGVGLFVSTTAVAVAALVEIKRLQIASAEDLIHQKVPVPMSILWQAPQYLLVGVGEVFTSIGQAEFFYNQSPDAMRSLCSAFALVTVSLGSYLSSFILALVSYFTTRNGQLGWIPDNLNEGHLDRFFWLISGLSSLNLLVFIYYAQQYKCKRASVV
ncbi:protein NRT1/ PTR FAMILY 8.3-like isoform X2 [Phragmites australis]|uniref:protein NRT1/ PTR FAMILY 8.3-like isoform X2 n=1 Tax=Phragmites australis TaxID=29695 RepID=UPI002D787194|nr:protein NRT1/ PTR FAMILY 8.3-like isoform X2 [Phragmites australis]